ncbi:MAG TPA: LysM peptidoglycan-binding domain-containing protein [Thermoanaerobaculia bacterium]
MRVRLSGFVLASLALVAPALSAADRPPQDLHLVGDHWTAWDPPTPPEDAQVHVIQRGDTLWDLAARFYGDPYLWPQLWERNQYILDAHWIYPGDPLVLGPQVAPVDRLSEETAPGGETPETPAEPGEGVLTSAQAAGSPVPLGAESDIYCSGYIGEMAEEFPYSIIGSEHGKVLPELGIAGRAENMDARFGPVGTAKFDLSAGDIIYLDGGRARGLSPGTLFTAVEPLQPVIHPLTKQVVGRYYHYTGRVRVLSVQEDTAIAEIVHSCDPVHVGTALQPFEPEPVPLGRPTAMRPVNFPARTEELQDAPVVLFAKDEVLSLFEDHVVFIDRGADQDVTPGDVFTIYRLNRRGLPPIVLGELAVLSVHRNSAVARIIEARHPIYVGDRLDPK